MVVALMSLALPGVYAVALALPFVREFFELAAPSVEIVGDQCRGAAYRRGRAGAHGPSREERELSQLPDRVPQPQVGSTPGIVGSQNAKAR